MGKHFFKRWIFFCYQHRRSSNYKQFFICQCKIKRRYCGSLPKKGNERPDSGPHLQNTVIHLFWRDEIAEIFIDTSGETLAKHGYRKIPGKAPMLEALAAATLNCRQLGIANLFLLIPCVGHQL